MLFVVLITLRIVGQIPSNAIPILRALLLSGVVGAALTMVAMEYFLFGFDNSSSLKKAIWFCILLLPPLGPALYCFVVYSRVVGKSSESLP
jgi:hypothetical protein